MSMPQAVRRGLRGKVKGGFEHSEGVRLTRRPGNQKEAETPECSWSHEVQQFNVPVPKHDKRKGPQRSTILSRGGPLCSTFLGSGREQRQTLFVKTSIIQTEFNR